MTKKLNKKDNGFTLSELLIVVAIIAALAIVSIPIFRTKLEGAREQADISNLRAAKSAAVALLIENETLDHEAMSDIDYVYYYDSNLGELTSTKPTVGYGKGTIIDGNCDAFNLVINLDEEEEMPQYTCESDVDGCYIKVTINISGRIDLEWEEVKKS